MSPELKRLKSARQRFSQQCNRRRDQSADSACKGTLSGLRSKPRPAMFPAK